MQNPWWSCLPVCWLAPYVWTLVIPMPIDGVFSLLGLFWMVSMALFVGVSAHFSIKFTAHLLNYWNKKRTNQ